MSNDPTTTVLEEILARLGNRRIESLDIPDALKTLLRIQRASRKHHWVGVDLACLDEGKEAPANTTTQRVTIVFTMRLAATDDKTNAFIAADIRGEVAITSEGNAFITQVGVEKILSAL